jgi:hypothetical protein
MSICLINGEFEEDQAVKEEEDGEVRRYCGGNDYR